ncbi:DUF6350 family protein [Bifidobacterium gallicum]|uniref:Uncharacterized protein n=1 Tax=Bifidobacterium gallicum DSM 20093 = LMG 11596 TaxID=561180 RepID=D1NTL3_9BIFI|nr:DUF6350 family protein [Bifidobacterium gallicum]EFA23067.1 hypothetical protein BIFGAL_03171 [Bifidobacterium gallicum DSM 20093 = LMG 11596]KFI58753.1 hypothetical protein BGLCM_1047 [Bifidobacterium gallicum DSM 20093 = LMG 11596]
MMNNRALQQCLRGAAASAVSLAVFCLPLGCFLALALLIVSMEESGVNLSSSTVPLTQMVMMLTQGVGLHTDSLTTTIMPLLLTFLMIVLIRAFTIRFKLDSVAAWICGVVVWVGLQLALTRSATSLLVDSTGLIMVKTALVFTLGFVWGTVPGSLTVGRVKLYLHTHVSKPLRHTLMAGLRCACILLGAYLLCGLVTLICWVAMGAQGMGNICNQLAMQNGSRVIVFIMALAWLPNLWLWALSWLFGAGFHIGSLATFSLWQGSIKGLPALPVFGLFPTAVHSDALRSLFLSLPLVISAVVGLSVFVLRRGFPIFSADFRTHRHDSTNRSNAARVVESHSGSTKNTRTREPATNNDKAQDQRSGQPSPWDDGMRQCVNCAYAAGAFCMIAAIVCLTLSVLFGVSDGALGENRLAHVGVDVTASTYAVARPTAIGLFAAWLCAVVVAAAVFGVRVLMARRARQQISAGATASAEPEEEEKRKVHTPRVVNSNPTMKEHNGDNEPTITTSPRIGLP